MNAETPSSLAQPRGIVSTIPTVDHLSKNVMVRAGDDGVLSFDVAGLEADEDPFVGTCTSNFSAFEVKENRSSDDPLVFTRHLVAADRDGRLWQRSVPYLVRDVWSVMADNPWVQPLLQPDDLKARQPHLAAVEQRWLLPLQRTLCDDREDLLLTVWNGGAPGKPNDPGEERVFRLRLKYFGAEFGFIERVLIYPPRPNQPAGTAPLRVRSIHLVFRSHVDAQSYPDSAGRRVDLLKSGGPAGPIFETRAVSRWNGWTTLSLEPAQLADRSAWEAALRAVGVADLSTVSSLRSNPSLKYERLEKPAAGKE